PAAVSIVTISSAPYTPPHLHSRCSLSIVFFSTAPATTEIYTLSLHDAIPISASSYALGLDYNLTPGAARWGPLRLNPANIRFRTDRKSTRLNSSHQIISYAVFCLKKKKKKT